MAQYASLKPITCEIYRTGCSIAVICEKCDREAYKPYTAAIALAEAPLEASQCRNISVSLRHGSGPCNHVVKPVNKT